MEQIIDVAVGDSELWVSMLAEALKTYPATGSLNTEISDLDEVRPIFTDLVNDLKKLVKKQPEHVMLPMECHYLNKAALISLVSIICQINKQKRDELIIVSFLFLGGTTTTTRRTF